MRGFSIASYVHFIKGELKDRRLVAELLELERLAPSYSSRESLITDCFQLLAGQSWTQLVAWGQEWYERAGRSLLIREAVERLTEHRRRGDTIVFVSGSWLPCLLPVARDLGAEHVYCCEVEVANGLLTGETLTIMVADAKAEAVRSFAARHEVDLSTCYGYGDDVTDTAMLSLLGHPVAVNPTAALAEAAHTNGWELLPA